jgi:hypothetical protein
MLKEFQEIVNGSLVNLVLLNAEEAAHQWDSDAVEGSLPVVHE